MREIAFVSFERKEMPTLEEMRKIANEIAVTRGFSVASDSSFSRMFYEDGRVVISGSVYRDTPPISVLR